MNLADLIQRTAPPYPWHEGDNIPWHEPGFSKRMLKEHLSQSHDAASRRFAIIDRHVEWIHTSLLSGRPSRVLDLACGPGFYSERLARLGHTCYGIDYSPASIDYAISTASGEQLSCTYVCQDLRQAEFPQRMDFAMLIFGEFNVFRLEDAARILEKACDALDPGGILLLEPHPFSLVEKLGKAPASWYSSPGGLFSDRPHLVLKENFWDGGLQASTMRYFVIDAESGLVTRYAQSMQAYRNDQYRSVLAENGFEQVQFLAGLPGTDASQELLAITARKKNLEVTFRQE